MQNNFLESLFKNLEGADQKIDMCIVTKKRLSRDVGTTVISDVDNKRYAIIHETLYQRAKGYIHKDHVVFDEGLTNQLLGQYRKQKFYNE